MPSRTIATTANYTPASTVDFARPANVALTVLNAAIVAQFKIQTDTKFTYYDWGVDEIPLIQGVWTFTPEDFNGSQIYGVRVKSAAGAAAASVNVFA